MIPAFEGAGQRQSTKGEVVKRILISATALGALCTAIAVGPAGAQSFVYAPRDCTTPKIEPHSITLSCADDGAVLKRLGWDDWNAEKVKGEGKLLLNDCDPNCAGGTIEKYKVRVTLKNIKMTECGGQTVAMYSRAHLRFPDKKPPDKNNLRSWKVECNP
jgi:hypothetical protein